jgi:ATP-binding cassette, subfamily G (WHITE), member 1
MFDQLYTLSDGQCVYQGSTRQLVPFLSTLNLECPSYHNPASYVIEVACGEHGDHTRKLVNAIENGKKDIRSETDFPTKYINTDVVKVHSNSNNANLKSSYDKNGTGDKFADNLHVSGNGLIPAQMVNDIAKTTNSDSVAIPVDVDKEGDTVNTALLVDENFDSSLSPESYPTSEFHQFLVVLKRTLLFSRRDWVSTNEFVGQEILSLYFFICSVDADVPAFVCSYIGWIFNWCSLL